MSIADSSPDGAVRPNRPIGALLAHAWAGTVLLLIFYAALIVLFTTLSPFFLSFSNVTSIGTNMAFIGPMAAA